MAQYCLTTKHQISSCPCCCFKMTRTDIPGLFFCWYCVLFFFCYLQLWTSHFTLHAWVQELQARPPRQKEKKRSLSDVTEKKPQQCALLSAPLRGVQQQSTSTELFCLILLCRLCLSFSQRLNTKALPQR